MIGLDDKAREEALLLESTAWTLHALSKQLHQQLLAPVR